MQSEHVARFAVGYAICQLSLHLLEIISMSPAQLFVFVVVSRRGMISAFDVVALEQPTADKTAYAFRSCHSTEALALDHLRMERAGVVD